jgi:3-oxoacyl-[acyl-carrier protein] reductase
MIRPDGKRCNVIVTGGSRGIGLAVACRLASQNYRVLAVARQMSEGLAAAIAENRESCSLHFVPFDLGQIEAIPDLVRRARAEFGAIYGLVNNAAVGHNGVLATMHNAEIERLVRLNTHSPIVLTKYVVRHMLAEQRGRIVNIASVNAFTGYSGLSVYGATKASMIGFSRSLAREVGRLGITVNAVAPGFLDTEMTRGLDDAQRDRIVRRSALRRLPAVDDVADAVEFLMSDKARNISGIVLTVDAGATA